MSPLADAVIANSHAARREAVARGVDGSKIAVIPNGIDCDRFRPDPAGGERLRAEWGIGRGTPVVGMVARLDPVKNHAVFLRSASRVAISCRDVKFVCVGDGQRSYREKVEQLGRELGLGARLTWVGGLKATRAVYSALDVAVLSSDSESFPNVVAEAMACGRPVVATDTGAMLAIVGDAGAVVPPRDPAALAHGVLELLRRTRTAGDELSGRARARIQEQFSVDALVNRTELALEQVMKGAQFEQGSPGYAAGDERSTRSARTSA
jgi:glycosyltransferase involved in cell wall biosynthesis